MLTLLSDDGRPLVGAYYFFRGDLGKAEEDLALLAEAGVNHLWLFIDEYFRKDEPRSRDEFEAFLGLLEKAGLLFVPVVGQFISIETHPEVRIQTADGGFSSDPRYWNMGCFRHPTNLEWALHEVREFLRAYKDSPHLFRIGGKILMSFVHEAYYRTGTPEMGGEAMKPSCYCPYCRESFLGWLRERYATPEKFNAAHTIRIASWGDLPLPAGPDPDPKLWLEWIDHHLQAIPDFLRALIRAARAEAPVVSTHECNDFYPVSWQTVLTGNDIWRMASEIEIGHEDMYPLEFDQQYQIYPYGLMKDIMRSAMGFTRPYTGNGQAFTPWVVPAGLPANSMFEQVYTTLIHEATGLVWWLGKDRELWRQTKEPNRILARWLPRAGELQAARPEVALFYSYTTLALTQNDRHTLDLVLLYTALRQLGFPVDVLNERQVEDGLLEQRNYRLIILPSVAALRPETRAALLRFAETGGTVLADAAEARWPAYAPLLAWEVPTSRPRLYATKNEGKDFFIPVESPLARRPAFTGGREEEVLAVFDGGTPAVASWRVGRGQVIGIGSMLGVDFANYPGHLHLNRMFPFLIRMNDDARELLRLLCAAAGIVPPAYATDPGVEVGVFNRGDRELVCFLANHRPERVATEIVLSSAAKLLETNLAWRASSSGPEGLRVAVEIDSLSGGWVVAERTAELRSE
ncbi:MAG: beta-galactosidase [Bacillota bacterium]